MAKIQLDEKQVALAFGAFAAILHVVWSVIVAVGSGQKFADWILGLHMLSTAAKITAFSAVTALTLIIVTFVIGMIFGWVFAKVWNWAGKYH